MDLKVENLFKKYDRTILNNVSFELEYGKVYCLLGRNGVGKTTLMKILSGIIPYDNGEIKLKNNKPSSIYYVPETPFLLEYLTGYENLEFIRSINNIKISKEKLDLFVEQCGISSFANELVINYSHGMKHQLALSIAFLTKPKVLLLDEPLTSLDPINIYDSKKRLVNYSRQDNIVIISTHMLPIAQQVSDEILILSKGTIEKVENNFTESNLEEYVLNKIKI